MNGNTTKDNPDRRELKAAMESLKKHRIGAYLAADKEELFVLLNTFIPDHTTVGCGDSVALEELRVLDALRKRDLVFLDKRRKAGTISEKFLC